MISTIKFTKFFYCAYFYIILWIKITVVLLIKVQFIQGFTSFYFNWVFCINSLIVLSMNNFILVFIFVFFIHNGLKTGSTWTKLLKLNNFFLPIRQKYENFEQNKSKTKTDDH